MIPPFRFVLLLGLLLATLGAGCAPGLRSAEPPPPWLPGAEPFRIVDDASGRVGYGERLGAGPQVLLVHGIGGGSSAYQYRRVAPALAAAGYEAIGVDLYGFGRSTRPVGPLRADELVGQLELVLDELAAPGVHVVANGLAAAYAVRLAVERPDRVASLTLIVPTGLGRLDRDPARASLGALGGPLGAALYGALLGPDVQLRFLLDAYADPDAVTPEVRRVYSDNLYAPGARWAVLSFVAGLLDQDLAEVWPQVTQPVWIAWGAAAETTPPSDAERFVELRPGTPVRIYEGAKLLPNVERADAFVADLLPFLARTLPWGEDPGF